MLFEVVAVQHWNGDGNMVSEIYNNMPFQGPTDNRPRQPGDRKFSEAASGESDEREMSNTSGTGQGTTYECQEAARGSGGALFIGITPRSSA